MDNTYDNKVSECRLAAALVKINALQADVDRLTKENTDLSIENIAAFGWAYGAGLVAEKDDFKGARELYLRKANGAGS